MTEKTLPHADDWLTRPAARRPVSLLCDLDGTLIEFAHRPDDAIVPADLIQMLNTLDATLGSALSIISGRSMESLDKLLSDFIGLRAGLHGAQIRHPLRPLPNADEPIQPFPTDVLLKLRIFLEDQPQLYVEDKGECVAVHHDLRPTEAGRLELRLKLLLLPYPQWVIFQGRQVIEIRPLHIHKGVAVGKLLAQREFLDRMPIALGDDITDIDLFDAVRERGGIAIAVGNRVNVHADYHLPTVQAALNWLARLQHTQALLRN